MSLLLDILFGAIGSGYLLYGWREHDVEFLFSGVLLAIYPYFFSNAFVILLLGVIGVMFPIGHHKGWF